MFRICCQWESYQIEVCLHKSGGRSLLGRPQHHIKLVLFPLATLPGLTQLLEFAEEEDVQGIVQMERQDFFIDSWELIQEQGPWKNVLFFLVFLLSVLQFWNQQQPSSRSKSISDHPKS